MNGVILSGFAHNAQRRSRQQAACNHQSQHQVPSSNQLNSERSNTSMRQLITVTQAIVKLTRLLRQPASPFLQTLSSILVAAAYRMRESTFFLSRPVPCPGSRRSLAFVSAFFNTWDRTKTNEWAGSLADARGSAVPYPTLYSESKLVASRMVS
jgi:hypothetical protein